MRYVSNLASIALAVTLLAGTAAAQTTAADKELGRIRSQLASTQKALTGTRQALDKSRSDQNEAQAKLAEMTGTVENLRRELAHEKTEQKEAARMMAAQVAAQTKLTDAELARTQTELAAAKRTLAETRQALTSSRAELAEAARAREILGKQVAAEKAQSQAAAVQLDLATKESARAKAELVAAQTFRADARQAKTQAELASNQKTLAETRTADDELRMSLEAEIKMAAARLEAANQEAELMRTASKTAAWENAWIKAELNDANKTLALQPALPVTLVVTLPANAWLTIDGRPTTSTGGRRMFTSPPLAVGPTFNYMLKTGVLREGKLVTIERLVEVRAGNRIEVTLK